MSHNVTIGTVPYLNGRPLVRWFWDTDEGRASGVHVVEAAPSRLAEMLEASEVAVAMVSSIEALRRPDLTFVHGCGVTADGPVRSVRLFYRGDLQAIRRVALDTSSLTSCALVRILLAERYGLTPVYESHPPDLRAMLADCAAALVIGDAGYREVRDPDIHTLDLGAEWKALTGLPFVYALWIGRPESLTPEIQDALLRARDWGIAHLEEIARVEFPHLDETYERTRSYLVDVMRYHVGEREEESLRLFGQKLQRTDCYDDDDAAGG